jgi:hypothetical protein
MTQDPLSMVDGPNVYCYLNNDPINDIDAWGLCEGIEVSIGERPLESWWGRLFGIAHKFIVFKDGRIVEMGPVSGKINVYDSARDGKITAGNRKYLDNFPDKIKWTTANINPTKFEAALNNYIAGWQGKTYDAFNKNSNYFVNEMIHSAGGQVAGAGYYAPGFPDHD